jgi:hypothetical protein
MEDAEDIFQKYARDPEVTKYLIWRPHETSQVPASTDLYTCELIYYLCFSIARRVC